jgi:hypothetical protein
MRSKPGVPPSAGGQIRRHRWQAGQRLVRLAAAGLALAALAGTAAAQGGRADHRLFDELLRRHVAEGLVDYDAFARSPDFDAYLELLDRTDPDSLAPAERLAFWINAYNAYTIELINRHGERESIRNINKTLGFIRLNGPWQEAIAQVGGRAYTLDEVEHRVIRREFAEPRAHFALVSAALGSPPLRAEAYSGDRLEEQLEDQTRLFLLQSPEKNRVDATHRIVYISPLLKWYRRDFEDRGISLGSFIARYHPPGPERRLLESGGFRIRETRFDWLLNSAMSPAIREASR